MERAHRPHGKPSSRTWTLGCFAAALVGLISAAIEVPFHRTSAVELAVVSGVCLVLATAGRWSSLRVPQARRVPIIENRHLADSALSPASVE